VHTNSQFSFYYIVIELIRIPQNRNILTAQLYSANANSNETVLNQENGTRWAVFIVDQHATLAPDPPVINKTRVVPAEIGHDRPPRTICRVSATTDLNELSLGERTISDKDMGVLQARDNPAASGLVYCTAMHFRTNIVRPVREE